MAMTDLALYRTAFHLTQRCTVQCSALFSLHKLCINPYFYNNVLHTSKCRCYTVIFCHCKYMYFSLINMVKSIAGSAWTE